MDAASIKIVFAIFYLTLLVVIGCIWFRVTNAPNGDIYRQTRKRGGYEPLDGNEIVEDDHAPTPNNNT